MSAQNKEEVKPIDKQVTTKDIANLYSHLQTMIDNVPKSPRYKQPSPDLPLTPTASSSSLNIASPTTSTSKSLPTRSAKEPDCPCHHILVSKDSQHCALCDDVIPILAEIQDDREKKRNEIEEIKSLLKKEQVEAEQQQKKVIVLTKKEKELSEKIKATVEQYKSLQKDLVVLEKKYEFEKTEAEKAKKDKAAVENELEDLSQRLFEEANGMVANEKREKHQLEIQYRHLQEELKLCREQVEAEELQLRELKQKMCAMEEAREKSNSVSNLANSSTTSLEDSLLEDDPVHAQRASRDMSGLFTHEDNTVEVQETTDPMAINEFKAFFQLDQSIPIRKLHSATSFMKCSLTEDVEPCLRFGPNSRLSPKKLYEAILLNTCFIEETPYGFAIEQAKRPYDMPLRISASKNMIWERLSSAPVAVFTGCQACGRVTKDLPYRFRISMVDDWACIDRYCRDRLVAVCEFYTFIRNIRQGYYNGRTLNDLYGENIRLKLQMFYARMGTLSQTLQNMGIKGDTIGHASPPNMVIPPPISESETDTPAVVPVDGNTAAATNTTNAIDNNNENDIHTMDDHASIEAYTDKHTASIDDDKASVTSSQAESNISHKISDDEEEEPKTASTHPENAEESESTSVHSQDSNEPKNTSVQSKNAEEPKTASVHPQNASWADL
ncbi:Rab guanine nucleotide exchange factor SEC2 [Choanephora cucurbitarum]|uniref:Rab guanine nucleotide exchange factor SEC2 n=1 Tax=Choanephora cucurbitarum TaxID=101091 RepID=A0A1C7NCJ5_9FUNG|nr:Rab guanine nucleotide exchange factor SEC2 [Choanephora cucurbitarum]